MVSIKLIGVSCQYTVAKEIIQKQTKKITEKSRGTNFFQKSVFTFFVSITPSYIEYIRILGTFS